MFTGTEPRPSVTSLRNTRVRGTHARARRRLLQETMEDSPASAQDSHAHTHARQRALVLPPEGAQQGAGGGRKVSVYYIV